MSVQFVDGWSIVQVLGEGAFGEVKLLVNDDTKDVLAVKVINTDLHKEAKLAVKKEIAIHRALSHPNIIKYFGYRTEETVEYIFLEYASGGELFDKIEPDVGMQLWEAQKYFIQLVSGVDYLHTRGVSHRDIKPENILLDYNDNVKLSDFGMATLFRKNGVERLLDKKCGTMPYVAPEVLLRPYKAVPADIWSCGIVLVAMLAGELPWDVPSPACKEYTSWKNDVITQSPWNKLDNSVLCLLKKILTPLPDKRLTAGQILKQRWCSRAYPRDEAPRSGFAASSSKRLFSGSELSPTASASDDGFSRLCLSQPQQPGYRGQEGPGRDDGTDVDGGGDDRMFCFSQPAHMDDLLLSSQLHSTQATTLNNYQKLVRRMTRFFMSGQVDAAVVRVAEALESMACTWRRGPAFVLTFNTIDRRKNDLIFKANIVEMAGQVLFDFRLSRGCGLEFKKLFLKTKEKLGDAVVKGPATWNLAT